MGIIMLMVSELDIRVLFLELEEFVISLDNYLGETQVQIYLASTITPRLVPTTCNPMPSNKLMP
jgi:hypothetical protein